MTRSTFGSPPTTYPTNAQRRTGHSLASVWGKFTGTGADAAPDKYTYIKSFIYLDGKRAMMPTQGWGTEARYIPGQVWAGPGVPRADVNPRPLHPAVPSNGLIGCYSADGSMIFATAFEPYQELFQGVIRCLHSDFRLGGLKPGERLEIRGKIYIVKNDEKALLKRYNRFPNPQGVAPKEKMTKGASFQPVTA